MDVRFLRYALYAISTLGIVSLFHDVWMFLRWERVRAEIFEVAEEANGDSSRYKLLVQYVVGGEIRRERLTVDLLSAKSRGRGYIDVHFRRGGGSPPRIVDLPTSFLKKAPAIAICVYLIARLD